jgi:predicted dehydrogenase
MFKVGIIGCGMIAGEYEELEGATVYSHGKAFYKNPVFEIKGFHDIDLTKAESLAKKFGGKAFHKIDQLLENIIPDVISICTPDYSHADILVSILKNKNHPSVIFVEKPICITPQELKKIKKAQSKTDTEIVVNHSRRFDSGHIELETLISKKN